MESSSASVTGRPVYSVTDSLRKKRLKVDLLIVDELGYTPFDRAGGELLHGVLCERYDARRSVLVTTNLYSEAQSKTNVALRATWIVEDSP